MVFLPSSIIHICFLPATEYEQPMRITYKYGGDKVLAGTRELLDSETYLMADEVHDDKAIVDFSDEDLTKALNFFFFFFF